MKHLIGMFILAVMAAIATTFMVERWDGRHALDGAQMRAIHYAPGAGLEASARRRYTPN